MPRLDVNVDSSNLGPYQPCEEGNSADFSTNISGFVGSGSFRGQDCTFDFSTGFGRSPLWAVWPAGSACRR